MQSSGVEVETTTEVTCCEINPTIALGLVGASVVGFCCVVCFCDLVTIASFGLVRGSRTRLVEGWAVLGLATLFGRGAGTGTTADEM